MQRRKMLLLARLAVVMALSATPAFAQLEGLPIDLSGLTSDWAGYQGGSMSVKPAGPSDLSVEPN